MVMLMVPFCSRRTTPRNFVSHTCAVAFSSRVSVGHIDCPNGAPDVRFVASASKELPDFFLWPLYDAIGRADADKSGPSLTSEAAVFPPLASYLRVQVFPC